MRIALGRYLGWTLATMAVSLAAPSPAATQAALAATEPALVGAVSSSGAALSGASSVAVSGGYAYSTAYYAGELTVIDIANPAAPTVVASTQLPSPPLEDGATVTIVGNLAFVASKNRNASKTLNDDGTTGDSLTVINIANPLSPQVLGSVHDPGRLFGAYGVAVSGHYAYVASQGLLAGQPTAPQTSTGSFSVIDLNNLAAGVVANIDNGSLPAKWARGLEHATSVAVAGNYAYVTAFYSSQLTVVNIANPLAPTIVASLGDSRLAYNGDVAVQGGFAYVTDQTSGSADQFAVVSIANPAKPKIVSAVSNPLLAGAYRIRVRGDFAEVSASDISAITAVDISNPAAARVAGSVSDPAHLNSTTGLDLDPSGRYVVAVSPELATEHPPNIPPYPLQTGGPTVTGTISVIDLDPAPIAVAIDPASEPPKLTRRTSATFRFSTSDAVSTVRCGLDGTLGLCTSATSQQYGQLIPGVHSFSVAAIDAAGHTSSQRYQWKQYGAPRDATRPKLSGAASWGKRTSALRATVGLWTGYPAPAFSYRWMRCGSRGGHCRQIRGQAATKHTIAAGDIGSRLEFVAIARNRFGSSFAVSALTPVVSGTPAIKQVALTGLPSLNAQLKLVVAATQKAPLLKKLVLAPARGLSFGTAGNALAGGITILDSRRRRLRFRAAVVRGSLVITLRSAESSVQATVGQTALAESAPLATSVKNKRTKTLYLSVGVTDARNATTRIRVRVHVS